MQPAASERSVISPCGSGILSSIALAPISFRVTERESHLLHQRSTLDSRVYECGFEGTVAVGSAFAPVAVVHDEAVLVFFPLFSVFTCSYFLSGSLT